MQQVFMLNIGTLPDRRRHPVKRRHCERAMEATPGLIEWFETKDHGTLLFFGTRSHAEKCMQAMKESGNPVEDAIYLVDADYETRTFHVGDVLDD